MRMHFIRWFDRFLQAVTIGLIVVLAVIVLAGVTFRYTGNSLIWYDEVAIILLAWITFTGATLAVLRDAHLGFNGLLYSLPPAARLGLFALNELIFLLVFGVVAWGGWVILGVFGNETMTTLRFVPRSLVQSVVPVTAGLMMFARLASMPERLANVRIGRDPNTEEIEHEIARAEAEIAHSRGKFGS